MATGPRRLPVAVGSYSTQTEEGRAFFQSRLALFGGWVFLISGGFFLVGVIIRLASNQEFIPADAFHLTGTLIAGGIWLVGRFARLSAVVAQVVDGMGTLLLCGSYALMAGGLAVPNPIVVIDPMHALFIGLLACSYTLISRAIAVPSTPGRTTGISAVAMVPMVATSASVFAQLRAAGRLATPGELIDVLSWSVAAVAMAAVASRVIFGLRAEVAKIRQLGQYTLEEKIGEGGMGVVYRASHAMLRRPTAIKLLPPEKAGEENLLRFEREVQLTAGLSHPSTVAIFDYGRTPDGVFYYAMEYLDGIDLERLVRDDGEQPPGRVVHILEQVCGALAEAHEVGLIHRDVKPANIILCERGGLPDVAKVVDFGLVKRIESNKNDVTLAVTGSSVLLGTPLYLAPETISGEWTVDGRSDLYAVGAVGYFLLTGTPVFTAKTVVEVCAHHLHTEPESPSRRLGRQLPGDLERLILQCLAKSPSDRPADARALQRALARSGADAPWSTDQATQWWAAFRRSHAPGVASPAPSAEHETAVVDLAGRLPLWP